MVVERQSSMQSGSGGGKARAVMNQASRNMDEHLRQMNEQASLLDKRLSLHGEESESWHRRWDDPS
jgi:hypothetical protein